ESPIVFVNPPHYDLQVSMNFVFLLTSWLPAKRSSHPKVELPLQKYRRYKFKCTTEFPPTFGPGQKYFFVSWVLFSFSLLAFSYMAASPRLSPSPKPILQPHR